MIDLSIYITALPPGERDTHTPVLRFPAGPKTLHQPSTIPYLKVRSSHLPPTQHLGNLPHPFLIRPIPHRSAPRHPQPSLLLPPTRRALLQQRRDRDRGFPVPDIDPVAGWRAPLCLRVVEDPVDFGGEFFLRGDEGAGVHVEGVEGVAAGFDFLCLLALDVGEFASVDCTGGCGVVEEGGGSSRRDAHSGWDGGVC